MKNPLILVPIALLVMGAKEPKLPAPPNPPVPPITTNCSVNIPYGPPTISPTTAISATPSGGSIHIVCKTGYLSYFDIHLRVPRFVGYVLTADETFGCLGRYKNFHVERDLDGLGSSPSDYKDTGYDLGHNMPAEDNATLIDREWDSFSMANIAPQIPNFNREGWESLEQDVRDWAWMRGSVIVYVGSIFTNIPPTKIIGKGVAVPDRFYKVVIDPRTNETIAFIMDNVPTPKGDMSEFQTTIADVEKQADIRLMVPDGVDKTARSMMWAIDHKGWHAHHKEVCP